MNLASMLNFGFIFLIFIGITPLNAQQKVKGTLEIEDDTRKYRLFIPSSYNNNQPIPLVFNLHGITSDAGQQQLLTQMNEVAEAEGFIVCYPKGKNRAWNVNFPFPSTKADDVQFISNLIDHLKEGYNIDLNRVYACGFSNGGYMSHKLACELSTKIVAIASVSGTFVPGEEDDCQPERTVPILQIHGTADPIVRYKGNAVSMPIKDLIEFWQTKNSCAAEPIVTPIDNSVKLDFSRVTRYDFTASKEGVMVSLLKIKNGGHTWPGAKIITGVTNKDIDGSTEIWNFFKQFSFDAPIKNYTNLHTSSTPTKLKIVPNPNLGDMEIQLNLSKPTTLSRALYNLNGQQISPVESATFPKGVANWAYSLPNIDAGIYFLKFQLEGQFITKKVVIRR